MRPLALLAPLLLAAPLAAQERIGLAIELDAEAAARLQDMGEWVTVSAWYYGEPTGPDVPVDEMGLVYLGSEEFTVYPASQRVELGGGSGAMPAGWAVEPMVNVNIYTARVAHEDNLLDCDLVEGPVAALAGTDARIACRLLGD